MYSLPCQLWLWPSSVFGPYTTVVFPEVVTSAAEPFEVVVPTLVPESVLEFSLVPESAPILESSPTSRQGVTLPVPIILVPSSRPGVPFPVPMLPVPSSQPGVMFPVLMTLVSPASPEVAGVFASAPFKTGVSTHELFVCPDEVTETIGESPVIPVLALDTNHVLSALPVIVPKTACEFI